MKKVFKNIVKSIAGVCLILEIISTVYLGIYVTALDNAKKNDNKEIMQYYIDAGKNVRDDINSKTEEEGNEQIGFIAYILPMYARLESVGTILAASIIIGSVIGIAMSIDENSKKKIIITYLVMYLVIISILVLYEVLTYSSIDTETIFGFALEMWGVYTVIYTLTILMKRVDNNRKVKIMNKELK